MRGQREEAVSPIQSSLTPCYKGPKLSYVFVCLLQDASGHSNILKAGKAEELKNARKRRTARKAN